MQPGNLTHHLPPFAEASSRMSAFLRGQGAPESVVWVFRDDVTSYRRQIWVGASGREGAESAAEALFETLRRRGLGVAIRAACQVTGATACYVWAPADTTEAEYTMQPPSLKLMVPTPLIRARVVSSSLRWRWLHWRNADRPGGDALLGDLPGYPPRAP